jgi:glycosyltransferase involved in cell wall biosynthesis
MTVLIVSQPGQDGVLRHVDLLCRSTIRRGVRLHLAYSDRQSSDQLRALVEHVAESGGRTLNLRVGNAPQPADVRAMRGLLKLIGEERPDVIHAHSSKAGGLVRCLPLFGVRTPILYTPNAYFRMHDPRNWKARLFHFGERLLGKVGTTIVMGRHESEFARDVLKVPLTRQVIIPNGIDTEQFRPVSPERKRALREKFGVPVEVPLLGTVGRFSRQKNPEVLYRALAEAAGRAPDLHFAHLGKGELEPAVDGFLAGQPFAPRLKRIPYLSNSSEFYQMLDGFILTSLYEGLSYAALEAFACGLPAVLTDAPGNADLADYEFSHIWWIKPGDVASTARGIASWHDSLKARPLTNHRELMTQHFTEEICNARVYAAYQAALEREAARA